MTNKYIKKIEISSSGMVIAEVIAIPEERVCGLKFFDSFINSLFPNNRSVEKMCKKANKWADERISICEQQET